MKLRSGFAFVMVAGLAGCTGGTVSTGGDVSASAGELRGEAQLLRVKKRDVAPARTPLAKIARANARRLGAAVPVVPLAATAAPQTTLTYYKGPLLESVEIYAVFWGPNVNPDVQKNIGGFFGGITAADSPIQKMLAEYDVSGKTIGSGTFKGAVTDMDAPMPSSGTITDEMIEAEAARLADTGQVPAEDGKNILMFFFPPGVSIDQGGGSLSCQVFCAYHSTFTRNGNEFYYGVIPDQGSGGCEQGCGTHDQLNNTYSTTSHELIEAITDPGVGVNDIGWYDSTTNEGEIGDICVEWDGSSNNYTVQSEWSNAAGGCTDHAPASHVGITVSYDNTVVTATGSTATYTLTSTGSGALTLATADLATGAGNFGASFSPASINAGQSSTLTVSVPATGIRSQDVGFKVAATDADGVNHFAPVTMHVKGASPTITSADVRTGPSSGGTAVTLTGTNFGVGSIAKICSTSTSTCSTVTSAGNGTVAQGGYVYGTSGTQFQLVMPSHTVGASTGTSTVNIWVLNPNDPTPAKISFKYTKGAAPTVTGVSPPSGPQGTFVTITGTNFSSNAKITFGTQALDCDPSSQSQNCAILDDKTAIAITPGVDTGAVGVSVANVDGQSGSLAAAYDYGKNAPPSVDSLSVDTGSTAGGDYVTIFGDNFDATPTVTFGGVAATVKTVNPSFLGVVTPAHAAGMVDVVVANGDAQTAKGSFTYADGSGTGGAGGDDMGDGSGGTGGGAGGGNGGGTGDNGSGGDGTITVHTPNTLTGNGGGCAVGGDASSMVGLLLVGLGLLLAMRRRRA